MEYEKIIKLLDAGYSKEEIDKMQIEIGKSAAEQSEAAEQSDMTEQSEAAEQSDSKENTYNEMADFIKELSETVTAEIGKLKKAYEEYNISFANNKQEVAQGVDDIIAEIIAPTFNKEKEN